MENTESGNEAVAVYDVIRRLKGSVAKIIFGIVLIVTSVICAIVMAFVSYKMVKDGNIFRVFLLWALLVVFFALGPWLLSNRKQVGKLLFYNDRLSYISARDFFLHNPPSITILPEQISSVMQEGNNMIKIIYLGQTLCVVSEQATEIHRRVSEMSKKSDSNQVDGNQSTTKNSNNKDTISAEDIRKYKQLVDDGIISQEQFDEIIKKNT